MERGFSVHIPQRWIRTQERSWRATIPSDVPEQIKFYLNDLMSQSASKLLYRRGYISDELAEKPWCPTCRAGTIVANQMGILYIVYTNSFFIKV